MRLAPYCLFIVLISMAIQEADTMIRYIENIIDVFDISKHHQRIIGHSTKTAATHRSVSSDHDKEQHRNYSSVLGVKTPLGDKVLKYM